MVRAGALAALIATIGSTPASAQVRAVIHVNVGTPVVYAAPRVVVYAAPRPVIVRRVAAPNVIFVQWYRIGAGAGGSETDTGRQSFIPMAGTTTTDGSSGRA